MKSQIEKLKDGITQRDSNLKNVSEQHNEALRELNNTKSAVRNIQNDLENQSNALNDLRLQIETKESTIQQQNNLLRNMVQKDQLETLQEAFEKAKSEL